MKKIISSISIVVMLMIVMSSIIQFHHHDDNGNIIFAITTMCCNNTEVHHDIHETTDCNHCHHDDDHECGDGEDCSAHLGDYQATKQTSIYIDNHPTLLLSTITCDSNICITNFDYQKENLYIQSDSPINEGVRLAIGLRAPPYC